MTEEKTDENIEETVSQDTEAGAVNEPEAKAADSEETGSSENEGEVKEQAAKAKKDGKKGKKKSSKPDKRDEEIADLQDRIKRSLAEFDNFRKRTDKEKQENYEIGAKGVVEAILPVVDSFERGIASLDEDKLANDLFAQGMEKTYKQLLKALEDIGVKEIEALGKDFDANLHNAVMHEDNEELGENVVSEVFQKGYTYHDRVVRHSMVKVAN